MRQQTYDAVIFDMDGVIFDSERAIMNLWLELSNKYHVPDIEETCRMCLGVTKEKTREIMLSRYGDDFPYEQSQAELSALFHERYDKGRLPMKEGVIELLTYLKEHNKKVALASSTRRKVVEQELLDAGILPFFDQLICGDMVKRSKPEPDIFLMACRELKVKPERAYAIEDSYNGVRAASAGKLRTIMVPDLVEPTEEIRNLTIAVLPSLHKVKDYLMQQE